MSTGQLLAHALTVAPRIPGESTQQAVGYPSVFLLVALGALVPVVPTGAVVSSAAVVAFHQSDPLGMLYTFLVASAAAFLGDMALYWLGRRGVGSKNGSKWLAKLRDHAPPDKLAQAQEKLADHGVAVLVLSRLVPAGRIPVMLACLLAKWPMRSFARGDVWACLTWAATYQLIGILGGSLFPRPWQGVATAVGLTVVFAAAPALWRRVRPSTAPSAGTGGAADTREEGRGRRA
ncbi:DedA family protein [Streptomyces montanisoli]|uniref:VTT domain-containing protein n=1 Tax=Streptomyces montanisoli TaxID=2798581 RepID=A0A940RV78_9ACTN|nr:VTT domain-containing protein [Streptomyces montanisoli]MBP0458005.1 VTT domain-containing protein [Streptomyces montanisoli]